MPRPPSFPRKFLAAGAILVAGWGACAQSPASHRNGDLISGPARVVDGSSFDIKSNRIRLWGVDTPERGAACYRNGRRWKPARASAAALRECITDKIVTCRVQSIQRRWFRTLHTSECWTEDGQDVGSCMVRGGWATDYTCYSDGYYRDLETEAKNKGAGLWQCDNGPGTRRWGRNGPGVTCEPPVYRPAGPK
jgi:endonuclease YncB( thermonuclease family)